MATYGSAAAWLGLQATEGNGGTTVINNTELANDQADNEVNDNNDAAITQPADAAALAGSGATLSDEKAAFLPLGVFTIAPKGADEAVALVHLAVSKDGILRGTYYNLKTDKDQNIHGAVNKEDHSLAWTLGPKGTKVFHTWLEDLTDLPAPVTVRTEDGKTHMWTLARYTEKDEQKSVDEAKISAAAK